MNETRLRVSARSKMIESIFATGIPFGGRPDLPATLQDLARIMPSVAGVRRFGAAALDLAYVAAGRYDGYWERGLHSWDIAAGVLIAKEAGALVESLEGDEAPHESGSLIAGAEPFLMLSRKSSATPEPSGACLFCAAIRHHG